MDGRDLDQRGAARRWRLYWYVPTTAHAGLRHDPELYAVSWVEVDDPAQLTAFAVSEGWPEGQVLTLGVSSAPYDETVSRRINCRMADLIAWDASASDLPANEDGLEAKRMASALRQDFLFALRKAVNAAVADGVLARDHADGLMMLARDAVDDRRGGARPSSR